MRQWRQHECKERVCYKRLHGLSEFGCLPCYSCRDCDSASASHAHKCHRFWHAWVSMCLQKPTAFLMTQTDTLNTAVGLSNRHNLPAAPTCPLLAGNLAPCALCQSRQSSPGEVHLLAHSEIKFGTTTGGVSAQQIQKVIFICINTTRAHAQKLT